MDLLENRFIIRQTLGETFEFFFKNDRIFQKSITAQSSTIQEVICDVYSDFCVTQDSFDKIHILCQSTNGDILYLKYNNSSWEKHTILLSKTPELYNKHFYIISCNLDLHFFFVIKNSDSWMLIHQTRTGDKTNEPTVIDYVSLSANPFCVCKDDLDNLYVFYNSLVNGSTAIASKTYNAQKCVWQDYTKISDDTSCSSPKALVDWDNNIHLIWLEQKEDRQRIIYKKISANKYYENFVISEVEPDCQNIFLTIVDENIWLAWKDGEDIYTYFLDSDRMENLPIKYYSNDLKNKYSIYYLTNIPSESSRIRVNNVIGDTEDSIKLVIVTDMLSLSSQYIEESAVALESPLITGNISLYLENIKSYFYKISEKINFLEKQKATATEELQEYKKHFSKLSGENENLRETITMFDIEAKKLSNDMQNSSKKISYLNDLLFNRENEIKEKSKEICSLNEHNLELTREILLLQEKLNSKKTFGFIKRLFKFISK